MLFLIQKLVIINAYVMAFIIYLENVAIIVFFIYDFLTFICFLLYLILYSFAFKIKPSLFNFLRKNFWKLPKFHKFMFLYFLFVYAIPNKVLVHNFMKSSYYSFLILVLGLLCIFCPTLSLVLCFIFIKTFESIVFGYIYEKNKNLELFITKHIFNGDKQFSLRFINEFWGNPHTSGAKKAPGLIFSGALSVGIVEHLKLKYEADHNTVKKRTEELFNLNSSKLKEVKVEDLPEFWNQAREQALREQQSMLLDTYDAINKKHRQTLQELDEKYSFSTKNTNSDSKLKQNLDAPSAKLQYDKNKNFDPKELDAKLEESKNQLNQIYSHARKNAANDGQNNDNFD